jgi:Uma2 family endonuclease
MPASEDKRRRHSETESNAILQEFSEPALQADDPRLEKRLRKGRPIRVAPPTWDMANPLSSRGEWSEADYLSLTTNHLVELSDGCVEVPLMPTAIHQWIAIYLYKCLEAFAYPEWGLVLMAPFRVRLWPGKFREPDVVFMLNEHRQRTQNEYWEGADLAMEVVSDDPQDRDRDLIVKRDEYARAGIREYWIVDPKLKQITVLSLRGKKYQVVGEYKSGKASSRLLRGFSVDVASVFARM